MHEIFISYSSKHRDLTRELAAVLEEQYGANSVWWDHELEARASYATQIRAALEQSRVVVVIWTAGAMVSDYVYAEAQRALESGKLVNVRPRDMSFRDIPEPFNIHHIDEAEDYARILTTVAKVWNGTPIPTRVPLHETYFRQHGQRLLDPKLEPLPPNAGPVVLLQAKYAVVPYADVTGTAAELVAWCADDPRPISGRLIHGPGGLGKTRLMIDVAAKLRGRGWMAGFLDRPDDLDDPTRRQRCQALEQLIDHGDDAGLLLVLDYAEGRQSELVDLGRRLAKRPGSAARPIRLILLARSAGEWWERLVTEQPELDDLVASAVDASAVVPLSVIPQPAQRTALFDAAAIVFAERGWPRPSPGPPPELRVRIAAGEDFERPLAVQMAALLWLASAEPAAGSASIDKLLDRILGLERAHWVKLLGAPSEDQLRDLGRGIGQVTLVQGVESSATAERLLMGDTFYGDTPRARVAIDPILRALRRLYGRAGGIGSIEPDLLGEHHVAAERIGDIDLLAGCLAWIAVQLEERRARYRRDLLAVLQRATHRVHGAETVRRAEAMLDNIIARHAATFAAELVSVMIDTPGTLAQLLDRRLDELDEDRLAAIDAHLPLKSLSLMDLSLRIAQRRAKFGRALLPMIRPELREAALANLAARIGTLGIRLRALGRRERALAAAVEVVAIRRELVAARLDAFRPSLAGSLINLANMLSELGRREAALAAATEAVGLYRELATAHPDAFRPDLAKSLNNLTNALGALGRREPALAAAAEVVGLYRELATAHPDAFRPDLAMSLNNLANALGALGRREAALAAAEESVGLYRELVAAHPDAFRPDLAMSLNNLANALGALGRREPALAAAKEAVGLYRELAVAQPDAFGPNLAMSLSNLANMLSGLGRREPALAAAEEAVAIRRELAAAHPDAFCPKLAGSLNILANRLSDLGRREPALAAAKEAVGLYRELAAAQPDAFRPDLAMSLHNLANQLSDLGRREPALAAAEEAVGLYRELAAARPGAFCPDLANSLNNLANRLSDLGRRERALAAAEESVGLYRELAAAQPGAFRPDLSMALHTLATRLSRLGRREPALAAAEEAVAMRRELAAARPDAFRPDLASSLNNLANRLSDLGRREPALAAAEEAVGLYRELAAARHEGFSLDLGRSLGVLSRALEGMGQGAEAAKAAGEGLVMVMPLVERYPQAFAHLADTLAWQLRSYCQGSGLEPDAALLARVAQALETPD